MKSTRLKLAALAAGVALAVSACGGGNGPGHPGNTLEVFSWWTSGSEDAALKELINGFKAQNPGVNVVNGAVAGGGGSNAQAVLQTRLQGGNPPDTWQTHPGAAIGQYIDGDMIADLSSVYQHDGLDKVVPKPLVDAMSRNGKEYGVATGAHRGNVLFYNKKLLTQAGIDPGQNYSLDQFVADLGALKAKGITPLCLGSKDAFAAPELFENTLLGALGPDGWNALTTGKLAWDDSKVKHAADLFAKMLPYVDPDSSALTWDQATKRLAGGQCAVESIGDFAYGELIKDGAKDGTDFGYVPAPGTNGSFVLVVDTFVVAQNDKNADLGTKWASVISSKDVQLAFSKQKGSTPVRTDVDTSSLPPYQQQAAQSFRSDKLLQTIAHGQAMNPQFQQAFYDAVTQFVQTKNVDSFTQALVTAAKS